MHDSENLDKIRRQFDFGPYPHFPLEKSPVQDLETLFIHDLTTPYYLKYRRLPPREGVVILDAGCGSGYGALTLAVANPGAKVIGVDLSEKSLELARQRLRYHGIENCEFHCLPITEVDRLDYRFDYINCDEVIYLADDPAQVLAVFAQALKPQGIIRVNFHDAYQRAEQYRGQAFFEWLGLKEHNPEDMAIETVRRVMQELQDEVDVKKHCWQPVLGNRSDQAGKEYILMNFLFQCDKGFTPLQVRDFVEMAGLELIEMVHWRKWRLHELFADPENPPAIVAAAEAMATPWERLHLVDLLHPAERLIDFWCGLPQPTQPMTLTPESQIYLHPQLRQERVKLAWQQALQHRQSLALSHFLKTPAQSALFHAEVTLDFIAAAVLWPLLETPMTFTELQTRWQRLYPYDWHTGNPLPPSEIANQLHELLLRLESYLYVLIVEGSG